MKKTKKVKINCPMCNQKLILEKLTNVDCVFLICHNCNVVPVVVDYYIIKRPKRIKLRKKEKNNE